MAEKTETETKKPSNKATNEKWKNVGLFVAKTIFYFAILLVLVYLYSYSGIGGAKFIYKDF